MIIRYICVPLSKTAKMLHNTYIAVYCERDNVLFLTIDCVAATNVTASSSQITSPVSLGKSLTTQCVHSYFASNHIRMYIHTCIHMYVCTCMHNIHIYTHTYIRMCITHLQLSEVNLTTSLSI